MRVIKTEIPELLVLEPVRHGDHRGSFMETWRDTWQEKIGLNAPFVQDNHACSVERGVVRGLHFQAPPYTQAKLVWVTRGAIYDVAVDIRRGSPTYGKWEAVVLSAENGLRFFVPHGFAHGYMTLEAGTEVHYKVDAYYNAPAEGGLRWDDPALGIAWPDISAVLSEKDRVLPLLSALESPFIYRNKQ